MTTVEILNKSLERVAMVRNFYPIDSNGNILRYSKELSDWGECRFRVATKDPILTQYGDILQPHVYNIRIKRDGTTVWSGVIVDNSDRNKNYIEVVAVEYEYYLDKVLIRRDAQQVTGDGKDNYRTFTSGTMAAAVTSIINSAKTDFGSNHPLSAMVVSSANIENPDYPAGFTNENGASLTGEWAFTDYINLQFDYHSAYYVLKSFGIYANCDFEIDENITFKFKKFLGQKRPDVTFEYGTRGNLIDYSIPRFGRRMVNDMWGIAADSDGKILHASQSDSSSVQRYGLLQGAQAFSDVKDLNFLKTRMAEQLQFTKTPEDSPVNLMLDERGYPLGRYGIGDIVNVRIKDHIIDYRSPRRVVGITVTLHNTGREIIVVQTNQPRSKDVGI